MSTSKELRRIARAVRSQWDTQGFRPWNEEHHQSNFWRLVLSGLAGARVGESANATGAYTWTALLDWDACGAPTFVLGAGATCAFALTDVSNIRWRDFQRPFRSMLLLPSEGQSPLVFDSTQGRETVVQRIYVSTMLQPTASPEEQERAWRICSEAVQRLAREGTPEQVYALVKRMDERLRPRETLVVYGEGAEGEFIRLNRRIPEDPETTLEDCFAHETQGREERWLSERSRHCMDLVLRIVVSLCLSLDRSGTQMGKQSFSKPLFDPSQVRTGDNATIWEVGSHIKLDPALRDAARAEARQDKHPGAWKLHSELLVRGHWRNVPCGPGGKERRRRWIEPYLKGEGLAQQAAKIYTRNNA